MTCVYISGPMTGVPALNFPAFHRAAARFRALGHQVVNPAELDTQDTIELSWSDYLRRDIKQLVDCTHIALLPGWQHSRGAQLEKHIADALGMSVVYISAEELQ